LVERPTVGESSTHFLFERQEETRGQDKCGKPQRDDGFEIFLTEGILADLEKGIT
jgi:hypothetical protein